jgi:hypothetical protein
VKVVQEEEAPSREGRSLGAPSGVGRDAEGERPKRLAATARESLPQRWLLLSLLSLILSASFASDAKHDLLRNVGRQSGRSRPD